MATRKRASRILDKAQKRLSGLVSIDPALNLGDGVSVKSFEQQVTGLSSAVRRYNTLLTDRDKARIELRGLESQMAELLDRSLSLVAGKYGRDSIEYAQAGGVRRSERKRRGQGKKAHAKHAEHKLQKAEPQVQRADASPPASDTGAAPSSTANGHAGPGNGPANPTP